MKLRLYIIGLLTLMSFALIGQQQEQYTQFIFNKLSLNPAYAGSKERLCITGLYRNQWLGLEGAPQTQMVGLHLPILNRRVGIGANIVRNSIGITETIKLQTMYSYRFILSEGYMAVGLQASVRYFSMNFADPRLVSTQPLTEDGAISMMQESKFLPNFGAGVYYYNSRFYVGLSLPNLVENNLDFEQEGTILAKEVRHIYAMGGVLFDLNDRVGLQPSALIKYAGNAPLDADINLSLILNKKYTLGVSYRVGGNRGGFGESIDLILGIQAIENLLIGASYDITLSDIRDYNSGSMEILVQYCLGKNPEREVINPRFF